MDDDFKSPNIRNNATSGVGNSEGISGLGALPEESNEFNFTSQVQNNPTNPVNSTGVSGLVDNESPKDNTKLINQIRLGVFILLGGLVVVGLLFLSSNENLLMNKGESHTDEQISSKSNSLDNLSERSPVSNNIAQGPNKPVGPEKPKLPSQQDSVLGEQTQNESMDISHSHNMFGIDLMKELAGDSVDSNVVFSPTVISYALVSSLNGASNDTKSELLNALYLEGEIKDINTTHESYIKALQSSASNLNLKIANSFWYDEPIKLIDNYIEAVTKYLEVKVLPIDFASDDAQDSINEWILEATDGSIEDIVSSVSPDTRSLLTNALFFDGSWTEGFNKDNTTERAFTLLSGNEEDVSTMVKESELLYFEGDDFQSVKLPYGENQDLSMYVFLPENDLNSFIENLDGKEFKDWTQNYEAKEGRLYLPRFNIEFNSKLASSLQSIGINTAFSKGFADFTNMTKADFNISELQHKLVMEVDENGVSVDDTVIDVDSSKVGELEGDGFIMDVNKPFVFMLVDDQVGEILILGAIANPTE